MNSRTRREFWLLHAKLPRNVQRRARVAFQWFQQNPAHPSLKFKLPNRDLGLYSARVGLDYRVLATRVDDEVVWFWIGSHAEYDHLDFNS